MTINIIILPLQEWCGSFAFVFQRQPPHTVRENTIDMWVLVSAHFHLLVYKKKISSKNSPMGPAQHQLGIVSSFLLFHNRIPFFPHLNRLFNSVFVCSCGNWLSSSSSMSAARVAPFNYTLLPLSSKTLHQQLFFIVVLVFNSTIHLPVCQLRPPPLKPIPWCRVLVNLLHNPRNIFRHIRIDSW